ncbi:MAG: hypothetical protein WD489_01845 [Rhodovibrionaceae bacterium]
MRKIVIALALAALLLLAVFAGVSAWVDLGEVDISPIGWLAMAGGGLLSLLVGGGLMALLFHSSRSGHDDEAQFRRKQDNLDK